MLSSFPVDEVVLVFSVAIGGVLFFAATSPVLFVFSDETNLSNSPFFKVASLSNSPLFKVRFFCTRTILLFSGFFVFRIENVSAEFCGTMNRNQVIEEHAKFSFITSQDVQVPIHC